METYDNHQGYKLYIVKEIDRAVGKEIEMVMGNDIKKEQWSRKQIGQ